MEVIYHPLVRGDVGGALSYYRLRNLPARRQRSQDSPTVHGPNALREQGTLSSVFIALVSRGEGNKKNEL